MEQTLRNYLLEMDGDEGDMGWSEIIGIQCAKRSDLRGFHHSEIPQLSAMEYLYELNLEILAYEIYADGRLGVYLSYDSLNEHNKRVVHELVGSNNAIQSRIGTVEDVDVVNLVYQGDLEGSVAKSELGMYEAISSLALKSQDVMYGSTSLEELALSYGTDDLEVLIDLATDGYPNRYVADGRIWEDVALYVKHVNYLNNLNMSNGVGTFPIKIEGVGEDEIIGILGDWGM